jgi:hypothetical protein
MHNALSVPPSKAVIRYVTLVHLVANTPMKLTLWGDNIRARLVTDVVTSWRESSARLDKRKFTTARNGG